jgi:hypothetical protein
MGLFKGEDMSKVIIFFMIFVLLAVLAMGQTPATAIAPNSNIYIEPNNGFENYLVAAFRVKEVPLTIVAEKDKADFIMTTKVDRGDKPSWSQTIFLGKTKANEDAAITVTNAKTSAIAWGYAVHKYNAAKGQQSTAEAVAKHLAGYVKDSGKLLKRR